MNEVIELSSDSSSCSSGSSPSMSLEKEVKSKLPFTLYGSDYDIETIDDFSLAEPRKNHKLPVNELRNKGVSNHIYEEQNVINSEDIDCDEVESILKKYTNSCNKEQAFLSTDNLQIYDKSASAESSDIEMKEENFLDEEFPQISPVKINKMEAQDDILEFLTLKYKQSNDEKMQVTTGKGTDLQRNSEDNFGESNNAIEESISQKKKGKKSINSETKKQEKENKKLEKERKKIEKEKAKAEKLAEKQKLKAEAEREKANRKALLAINKNMKPEECMKFVTVLIDSNIINQKYGGAILNTLQAADIEYQVQQQLLPDVITWKRKTQSINECDQLIISSQDEETNEVLLMKNWSEVIELVSSKSLLLHVQELQNIYANKKIFLGIYGMQAYYKFQKNQKTKQLQSEIRKTSEQMVRGNKTNQNYEMVPKVKRRDLEDALTEIQLLCSCNHRMVETVEDVAQMVFHFTKAVAQTPYKLQKQLKQHQLEWYITGDNKDCVPVDKNGNGLQRLWSQQLTVFSYARLETAEAIASQYPTPLSLMQAYGNCQSQREGEQLLQNIPVRRAAGPLTNNKRIGPELSKKIYKFFNSTDGDTVL